MSAAVSVTPSSWAKFPFSHPCSFQKILVMLDTSTILNCRVACTDWRDWFTASKTIWSSVSSRTVARVLRRKMRTELEQVWDIRLDLLLEMVDECWTEEQEMTMAIRIERATRQPIWCEFDETLKVISQLHQAFYRGLMASPCVGPVCIFLRSKVAHPSVLKVMGETLARHLNCVIIDERDKEAGVVRQCLLRAMISCQQAPRWVFKDMDLGWLGEEEVEDVQQYQPEPEDCNDNQIYDEAEELTPSKFSFSYILSSIFNLVSGLFSPLTLWRMLTTTQSDVMPVTTLKGDEEEEEEEKSSLYSTAPTPAHDLFPTVLELLDCDSPWLKNMLIKKAGIDKILVVPKFEEVTKHLEDLGAEFTVAGLDMSGTVCKLDCGALAREEGAVERYIDHQAANFSREGVGLHFWGGRDVRQRWPVFEEIMKGMDGKKEETEEEWSDVSVQWSEDDIANEVVHCNDSEESKTSDLGVSPDLSCSDSVGDSFESSCSSSDLSLSGEKNEEVSDGVEREKLVV
eukprot:GFUD01025518.1.p1 GENE.GFUD01025518.1~~GFUD01025518.1.p1  ORF type:complete len:514 (+),score=143.60 GFUD01025518.1:110-1651(+)